MVITKIKGLKGKLLKYDDYKNLLNIGDFSIIKNFSSYKYLKDYEYLTTNLQNDLYISLLNDFKKLDSILKKSKIIKIYKIKMQILIIKILYSTLDENYDFDAIDIGIDTKKISKSKNKDDFLQALNGTEFFEVLKFVKSSDYIFYLDLYYYKRCSDFFYNKHFKNIINSEISFLNNRILQVVKKYTVNTNEYLIPKYRDKSYKFNENKAQKDYINYMKKLLRHGINFNLSNSIELEEAYFFYYIFLKELEIKNLLIVTEGIKHKRDVSFLINL
ncbi:MAG: V-type ATPase subunit [Defluviitaleaceae bacterium]|nr:V-type ATPase subunit [Defluviitaleaceae bacterium]